MAVFIINRSVNSSGTKTPIELYTGEKPDLSNLKIFGTQVMVHVPKQVRRKRDEKAVKMTFVGYDENTKGYRCIDLMTRKLILSRDAKFLETELKSEQVIVKFDNEKENLRGDEPVSQDDDQEETIVVVSDDSTYDDTGNDESWESTNETFDDPNDPDYEPSNESILDAEKKLKGDRKSKKGKNEPKVKGPSNLMNCAFLVKPATYKEACSSPESENWVDAMNEEIESHNLNETWTMTDLPGEQSNQNGFLNSRETRPAKSSSMW